MNLRSSSKSLACLVCAVPLNHSVSAQDEDLGSLANNALAAMNAGNWEEALTLHTDTVARFGKINPLQQIGPQFGTVFYRKGICEMKLKKWTEAMESFEVCYRDFPNNSKAGGGNVFQKQALLKWAEAAMGEKNWELAISQFRKFLKERDKETDKYPQGAFHISMAICHYQLGRIPEGNENLEIAINNKLGFPTPDVGIVAGFQSLVSAVIRTGNEQALLDFIHKNRGELVIEPYAMHEYSRVFLKLAGDALAADMERAAIALYQFVPSTEVALDDTRARSTSIGVLASVEDGANLLVKAKLEADLKTLEEELRGKSAAEMVKLGAMAFVHEKHGNVRAAHAAYQQLELYYPNSEKREEHLLNLVRTSSLVSTAAETRRYADVFLKTFPGSPNVPAVRRMMLSTLFLNGEYAACIEVAEPMIGQLSPNTSEHDICLHVLGGSFFHTGRFEKAQPLLEQHVQMYPGSQYAISSMYFHASSVSRLESRDKAAGLLDEFINAYRDASTNAFLPFALFDRAACHFAQNESEPALEKLSRIIDVYKDCSVLEQAYNLRGNIEQSLGNTKKAEESYTKALQIAETRGNANVAGESLYHLVALLGEKKPEAQANPQVKAAVPYVDRFWKTYGDRSPYKTRMAVAQVPALFSAGRGDEALQRLRDIINGVAGNPQSADLEELIHSYTEAYLENHSPEELKEHYYNFPGIDLDDRSARALLRVEIIGVYENAIKKSSEEAHKVSGNAMLKVLFQNLKTDFAVKDLTNFILVRVGDHLRNNTSTPREAIPYYDEALGRQDVAYRFAALLGRADVYGRSSNTADIDRALADFALVYAESREKPEREFSLYRMIELNFAKKDYVMAAKQAKDYLDVGKTGFSKFSPQVELLLTKSREENTEAPKK